MRASRPPPIAPFGLDLVHGRCVGVAIDSARTTIEALPPQEREYAATLSPIRQANFFAGRLALHRALADLGRPDGILLPTARGAPDMPPGTIGSISHKSHLAIALAAIGSGNNRTIGIDLEEIRPLRIDISRRVLTPREQQTIALLEPTARTQEILQRFSLKEAFYKAADRWLGRFISFQEVEITSIAPDGQARLTGSLLEETGWASDGSISLQANGYVIATVRLERSCTA